MQNESRKNPQQFTSPESGAAQAGEPQAGPAAPGKGDPEDFTRMKEWVEQARADAHRARTIAEQTREDIKDLQWELEDQGRKASRSGWTSVMVALALVVASVFGYVKLQNDTALLAEFPAVRKALDTVGQRLSSAETKISAWSTDWDGMSSRLSKMERNSSAGVRQARDYATEQAAKVHHELQTEMDNRTAAVDNSITELEASQENNLRLMARMQQQISSVRTETLDQLAQAEQETGRQVGTLRSEVLRNRDDFDAVASTLERRRLGFEIRKDQTREVAPGVTLTLSKMNVSFQNVEGRLHVIPDGRILWIRGQGIQQPVRFYTMSDNRPYEVVFTRVLEDTAVGYVLAPAEAAKDVLGAVAEPAGIPSAANFATEGQLAQLPE